MPPSLIIEESAIEETTELERAIAAGPRLATPALEPAQGLTTHSLQTASGLHSGARGLTSDEEWARLFPRPAKRP